jgi:hypothetical protein
MASAWAKAKACEFLFGDNFPSGAEVHVERLATLLDHVLDWEDVDDEWTAAIKEAHPTKSGSHEEWGQAMKMVGHRHSKGELVALVNWLLVRLRKEGKA